MELLIRPCVADNPQEHKLELRKNAEGDYNNYFLVESGAFLRVKAKGTRERFSNNESSLIERQTVIDNTYEVNLLTDSLEEFLAGKRDFAVENKGLTRSKEKLKVLLEVLHEIDVESNYRNPIKTGAKIKYLHRRYPVYAGVRAYKIWKEKYPLHHLKLERLIERKLQERAGTETGL